MVDTTFDSIDISAWLPHIPPKHVSDERKVLRKTLTARYGYATLATTIVFLLLLPYWNKISETVFFGIYSRIVRRIKFARVRNNWFTLHLEVIKIILFWTFVLGSLSVLQTYADLQFLAARLGRVATYCLPSLLFLTMRPSPLPHTLYLSLIPIHKWLSRIVVLQSLLHTVFYIMFFADRHTLSKVWRRDNLFGIVAMAAFTVISVTSLPKFRRIMYNLFYVCHYICTWIAVITLYFHVRPSIPYLTSANVCILVGQVVYRFWITRKTQIQVDQVSANLLLVTLPNSAISQCSCLPGCHLRIIDFDEHNYLKQLWKNVFAPIQHPFTLATLPIDATQKLIVRKGKFQLTSHKKYLVTGSFLPHLHFLKTLKNPNPKSLLFHTKVKKCLIVVGGSAISFALPILRTLGYNGAMVKIIWVIRDHEDLKVLDYFENILVNDDCIDIFITGKYSHSERRSFKSAVEELHRRRIEMEQFDQERMLAMAGSSSGAGAGAGAGTALGTDTSLAPVPEKGPFSPKESPLSESSPLFRPTASYEATTASDQPLEYDFDAELGHMNLDRRHRASYISLRNHHQNSSNGYSFADENKFENVDLDLGKDCQDPRSPRSSRGSEQVSRESSFINLNSPALNSAASPYLPSYLKPSPEAGFSGGVDDTTGYSKLSVGSSSGLYDDLADYWVLKGLSCRIEFGRPKFGLYYYNWCIGSSCIGPLVDLQSGKSVCCNEITKRERERPAAGGGVKYQKSNGKLFGSEVEDELFLNDQFLKNRTERFNMKGGRLDEDIWVIGAGPIGLVNKVGLWANDCGFHFHAESFSV